jgi:hypothetical protein
MERAPGMMDSESLSTFTHGDHRAISPKPQKQRRGLDGAPLIFQEAVNAISRGPILVRRGAVSLAVMRGRVSA